VSTSLAPPIPEPNESTEYELRALAFVSGMMLVGWLSPMMLLAPPVLPVVRVGTPQFGSMNTCPPSEFAVLCRATSSLLRWWVPRSNRHSASLFAMGGDCGGPAAPATPWG